MNSMKFVLALLCAVSFSLASAQTWKTINAKDSGISFMVPAVPKASTRTDKDQGISINTKMWISNAPTANYVVSVSVVPASAPARYIDNMIEGIKAGFLNSTSGTALSDKSATYANIKGREITFKTASGATGALWIINRNHKVTTLTIAKRSGSYTAERSKFFNSLRLK